VLFGVPLKESQYPITLEAWTNHVDLERFVGTLGVEFVQEAIELGLLLQDVLASGTRSFLLQSQGMRSCRPFCCG
jgi:hypothetical protein